MGIREEERSAAQAALESPRATWWPVDTAADRAVAERVVGISGPVPDTLPGLLAVVELAMTTPDGGIVRYVRLAGTLADRLDGAADAEERWQLVPLFIQLCATLGHAHEHGVSHGGLRPSTVALAEGDLVVIRDWDQAEIADAEVASPFSWPSFLAPLRDAKDLRSVPDASERLVHLAPEIVQGDATSTSARTDVYALGVMLYRLLTGQAPYLFQTYDELLAKLAGAQPPAPVDLGAAVPTPLAELIARCLARRPADRPADANEVAESVRAWLAHDLTSADLALHRMAIQSTLGAARTYGGDAAGERLDGAVRGCRALLERRPDDEETLALLAEAEALRDQVLEKQRKAEAELHAAREDATAARAELEHAQAELAHGRAELDRSPARQEAAVHAALRAQRSRGARRTVFACLATALAVLLVVLLVHAVEGSARVPELVGLTQQAALDRLHAAGLRAQLEYMPVPAGEHAGKVIDTTPSAQSSVPHASAVNVLVGRRTPAAAAPAPPRTSRIPATNEVRVLADMTGWTVEKAKQQLLEAGYLSIVTLEPPPSDALRGKVLRHDPRAGSPLTTTGTVRLIVGAGPLRPTRPVSWERRSPEPVAGSNESCHQLDLWVDVAAPEQVAVGEPFEAAVRAVNTGDLPLANVTLALRGSVGLQKVDDTSLERLVAKLAPGESVEIRAVFVAPRQGLRRIDGSANERRGWAAAGAARPVQVGQANDSSETASLGTLDLQVTCQVDSPTVLVGDPFEATARVTNIGDIPLVDVTLALRGGSGTRSADTTDDLRVIIDRLEPGASKDIRGRFLSDGAGERRIDASARDQRGWAAAGCFCGLIVKGLPALQLEMWDEDRRGEPKGVFAVGEEIVYDLRISNDGGTALTPHLVIEWDLPPELEFVSGLGEDGIVVSGGARSARSVPFVLVPDRALQFELVARVIAAPPGHLTKIRASVRTTSDTELATESESTTLVPVGTDAESLAVPALQIELTDLGLEGEEQGIFRVGEQFLFALEITGDDGTTRTPNLEVVWTLPAELEFVSGAGDRGVTVTGSGQSAVSSGFALESDETQRIELVVEVIGVPARHLVQTRATVQTTDGSELATETESSTLRPGPPDPEKR